MRRPQQCVLARGLYHFKVPYKSPSLLPTTAQAVLLYPSARTAGKKIDRFLMYKYASSVFRRSRQRMNVSVPSLHATPTITCLPPPRLCVCRMEWPSRAGFLPLAVTSIPRLSIVELYAVGVAPSQQQRRWSWYPRKYDDDVFLQMGSAAIESSNTITAVPRTRSGRPSADNQHTAAVGALSSPPVVFVSVGTLAITLLSFPGYAVMMMWTMQNAEQKKHIWKT